MTERCGCVMRPEFDPIKWDGSDCPLHYEHRLLSTSERGVRVTGGEES